MGNWIIPPPISLVTMTLNLLLGLVLSLILAWYYIHFGQSFANRKKFAMLLPVLTLTTAIVITIVKSSLALSLGLVGALSIVRFRTAIKDPEELVFLFIAITIGLGIGAEQNVATIIGVGLLLAYMGVRTFFNKPLDENNLYMNLIVEDETLQYLAPILNYVSDQVGDIEVRRMDSRDGIMHLTFQLNIKNDTTLHNLIPDLQKEFPVLEISLVHQEF
ncbi:MAG: DUF4956 domain-containing protein [Anaerolineae bacterium]|nr:DUF4956 domain-containing protein [Anaerolineae bacterium]